MSRLATTIALFTLGVLPLAAQTSSLQGVVADAQGAIVPDTVITVTNQDTAAVRKVISDAMGAYTLPQMAPGTYKVEAVKPGFHAFATVVQLQINTPATLAIKLDVGQVTETVNVVGEAATVNTENASVGNPFTETQVKQIPLQTRNVVDLLGIQPGVAPTGQVSGARPDQNNVVLDGVDVNDNQGANGFNSVLPIPLDSVQEFRTTVTGFSADMGRSSGGQVSVITKSGSNNFHGSLYEFNRNTYTEANDWFSNRSGVPRSALVRNQYGGSLGGPVRKNRAYFFFNYEGRKDRSAAAVTRLVPTDSFRQGIVKVQLKDGRVVSLNPQDVTAIDPLHVGASSYIAGLMSQYPEGNDPLTSPDKGLNFSNLRFNAPQKLDNHAMVGRMDFNLDPAGKHILSLRGTLNGAAQDSTTNLAEMPGQAAAQRVLDNSRGLSARYTAVLSPHLVNVATFGYTRLGTQSTGNQTVVPSFYMATLVPTARPFVRIAPVDNIADDLTWTKGRHSLQFGINFRFNSNDRESFNNVPNYGFARNTLLGLGADIDADVLAYLQPLYGNSIALSSGTNVTNAFGALLGLVNQYGATYNYTVKGSVIPFANPVTTDFGSKEFEQYAMDTFRWKRNLTVTYGLRYSLFGVPYEQNGNEVVPVNSLSQFFAERVGGQALGIPSSALPNAMITYGVGGPINNAKGYYPLDTKDFAPRFSMAYSPDSGSLLERIAGKGSVFRAGAGVIYDHYGSAMAANLASSGSPGLATTVAQPVNTNFTTGFRYTGGGLPTLPTVAAGAFPFTPPMIKGGFTTFSGVASDLKAPYEYVLNAAYARPLTHQMSLEIGYVGRLGHRGIGIQDYGQPLTLFKDSKSGQTWAQAGTALANLYNAGVTPAQVKANPSLIPNQPFFENIFGKAKNLYINGSATSNFFYDAYGNYSGSFLDTLNDMDRIRQSDGSCVAIYGCNTFFPLQNSGLEAFTNAGTSAYHAMTIVLRRAVSHGWGYDFNYTWSHSLDNGSVSETSGQNSSSSGWFQDAFNPNAFRGSSDFDMRHLITADAVVELPVGKGKTLLKGAKGWLDAVVGGWQVTTLVSIRTGTPLNVIDSGVYNVNYETSSYSILAPGAQLPPNHFGFDNNGNPSIFANTNAVNAFVGSYPGAVGSRGLLRGPGFFNTDLAIGKYFKMPLEGHRVQVRAEAFNVFNHVNFANPYSAGTTPGVSLANPTTFGEITATANNARVMQFALRYEF
jgi:hypothetical protein